MDLSTPAGTPAPLLTGAPTGIAYEDMDRCSICSRWTCNCLAKLRSIRLAVTR